MVPYHFFIIWMLALLSTATTFATLLALVQDFKRDWVLRWLRQFAMFVNLALTVVLGVFILQTNMRSLAPTLPIACVWQDDHAVKESGMSNTPLSIVGTIAAIVSTCLVFIMGTLYLHKQRIRWGTLVRVVSMIVMIALAIGAAARVLMVSQAFGSPSVNLDSEGEKQWSFGQLLTMLLLILPFITALEVFRGELFGHILGAVTSTDPLPRRDASSESAYASGVRSRALEWEWSQDCSGWTLYVSAGLGSGTPSPLKR